MTALFLSALLLLIAVPAQATQLYVGPSGTGSPNNCQASGSPCHWLRAQAVAACGDTINLQDGTYQGANQMMNMDTGSGGTLPANQTCSSGSQMTVRAVNDGGVFIDGEFARIPFGTVNLTYWNFSGFDVGNGSIWTANDAGSNHVTMRRMCFSNSLKTSTSTNAIVLWFFSVQNGTYEDLCAFGTGRNTIQVYSDFGIPTSNNIFRRIWTRFEGGVNVDNNLNVQLGYYHAGGFGNIYENFITVYAPEQQSGALPGERFPGEQQRNPSTGTGDDLYGWIVYGKDGYTGSNTNPGLEFFRDGEGSFDEVGSGGRRYTDIFSDSRSQPGASNGAFYFDCSGASGSCASNSVNRLTGIIDSTNGAAVYVGFSTSNINECTTLGACPNFYTGDSPGTGSRSCFRYESGTLTSTPLWPWPMDDRIKAALARANAAGTGGSALDGTSGSGYAAATVTSEIVSRYGNIPTACLTSSSFTPNFPVASDFPSVSVRDDFDRSDAPTLGTSWTELLSDTFDLVSNAAAAPSTGSAFARATYNDTKMQTSHEVYATWTTIPVTGVSNTFLTFAGTDLTENNQYRVRVTRSSSANTMIRVGRVDSGGNETTILSDVDLGIDVVDGNSFGVRVSGTTISVYWKWTDGIWYRVGQFTDSNLSSLPSTGVYGGIAGGAPAVIDNYGAGPFVDQPEQDPPTPPASVGVGRFGTTFPGVR